MVLADNPDDADTLSRDVPDTPGLIEKVVKGVCVERDVPDNPGLIDKVANGV